MPLYEFRCEDGHVEEHIAPLGTESRRNSCGHEAKRVWSVFALKTYQHDRSSWELVAPLNADGKPMTMTEAAKSGLIDSYRPGERERAVAHDRNQQERLQRNRMEEAKRDAWREVSARRRIEVR